MTQVRGNPSPRPGWLESFFSAPNGLFDLAGGISPHHNRAMNFITPPKKWSDYSVNRSILKNTRLLMCVIAALAIFTLPGDVANAAAQKKGLITSINVDVPVPNCPPNEIVALRGTFATEITWLTFPTNSPQERNVCGDVAGSGPCVLARIKVLSPLPPQSSKVFRRMLATGLSTGVRYHIVEHDAAQIGNFTFRLLNGQASQTFRGELDLNHQNVGFTIQFTAHVNWQNGQPTGVTFDNFQPTCG